MPTGWKGRTVSSCPLCSSANLSSAGRRRDEAAVSKCNDCGVGFLNPMPTESEIAEMYSEYYRRGDGIGYEDYPMQRSATGLDYLLWDAVKRYAKSPTTLLDVGCAYGARVEFFGKRGLKASGVDMSNEAVAYGKHHRGLDLHFARYEDFNAPGTFDIVTLVDFVEHLSVPDQWAQKTLLLTHPGSIVLILTPDFDCYHDYGERWIGYNTSFEHVLFYNRQALDVVLRKSGFRLVMTANFKSMPPVVAYSSVHSSTADSLQEIASPASLVPVVGVSRRLWTDLMTKITWRRLVVSKPRQNSLLVVAERR